MSSLPRPLKARKKKPAGISQSITRVREVEGCGTGHIPPPHPKRAEASTNKEGEEEDFLTNRLFDTSVYPNTFKYHEMTISWDTWTLLACPDSQIKCASCGNHPFHRGCMVVSISAKCLNNENEKPRCAIGIFYGISNKLNVASEINEDPNTEQVALLRACVIALTTIISRCQVSKPKKGNEMVFPLHTVVIKSDSPYVVQGITEWMPKWKENGWKNSRGKPVANESMWRLVDLWIRHLEPEVAVQFWLVPKETNVAACLCVYGMHGPKLPDGSSPGFLKLAASQ